MMEFRHLTSLHNNVRTGCPDTPLEAQVNLETFKERERERERERDRVKELTIPLLYYSRVFIMFRLGARFCNADLALMVMIAQR